VPISRVINTNPAAGSSEPKGTPIGIIVSSGPSQVKVPVVTGLSLTQAEAKLSQAHLRANPEKGHNSNFGPGQVFNQTPAAGMSVSPNSQVTISYNPTSSLKVPYVLGLRKDAAIQVLESSPYDYVVSWVITQGSNAYGPNQVNGTNPSPNMPLPKGSPITIYVNAPAPTPTPTTPSPSGSPSSSASPTPSSSSPAPNPS
jgi:eukaryotic-like serine/threonine-protein kinase